MGWFIKNGLHEGVDKKSRYVDIQDNNEELPTKLIAKVDGRLINLFNVKIVTCLHPYRGQDENFTWYPHKRNWYPDNSNIIRFFQHLINSEYEFKRKGPK